MSSKRSTKEKIISKTLHLLNKKGLKNIRLQHIADAVGISVGNLAYHFPDFKHLLQIIEKDVGQALFDAGVSWKELGHFIDFDNKLTSHFFKMKEYAYFYLDSLEIKRSYPDLWSIRKKLDSKQMEGIKSWLAINQKNGFLIFDTKEQIKALTSDLSHSIRYWILDKELQERTFENEDLTFRTLIWEKIFPYLSERGKLEFEIMIEPKLSS